MNSPQKQIIVFDVILIIISLILVISGFDIINRAAELVKYETDALKSVLMSNYNTKGSLLFIAGIVGLAIAYIHIHKQWEITVNKLYK